MRVLRQFIIAWPVILLLAATAFAKRNVILMIADGQGFNGVKAANMYKGTYFPADPFNMADIKFDIRLALCTNSASNPDGYDPNRMWSRFNYAESGTTDSAAAASAMYSGEKIYNGKINISTKGKPLITIFGEASLLGYATGAVTSVEISHATPGAVAAHNKDRDNYSEIANEMIYSSGLDVIMGAGHPLYDDDGKPASADYKYVGGRATFNDLTDANGANGFVFIEKKADFESLAAGNVKSLKYFGLAQVRQTLQQNRSSSKPQKVSPGTYNANVPTLATMSVAALNVLNQDADGFFVMIEGGAVDWANHANQKGRMIEEEMAFMDAVAAVHQWVEKHSSWEQTLLIVTADHETGHLYGPARGKFNDLVDNGKGKMPGMHYNSSGHTNALVPLYAKGLYAKCFSIKIIGDDPVYGSYIDNTTIHDILSLAANSLPTSDFDQNCRVNMQNSEVLMRN